MIEDATRSFAIRDVESGRKWIQNAVQEIVSEWAGEPVDLNFGLPPTLGALLNQSVETLPLSVTAYSFLKNMNIENVGDLLDKTETHLRAAGKASEKTVVEIKNVLAGMGLSLAKENIEGLSEEPRRPIRLDEDEGQS
jgi:DNA-directed RNA polymerase alpha subunit